MSQHTYSASSTQGKRKLTQTKLKGSSNPQSPYARYIGSITLAGLTLKDDCHSEITLTTVNDVFDFAETGNMEDQNVLDALVSWDLWRALEISGCTVVGVGMVVGNPTFFSRRPSAVRTLTLRADTRYSGGCRILH